MDCEECGARVWQAGSIVAAGTYVRVDDQSFKMITLAVDGPLPATFDGHVARYRVAGATCACMGRGSTAPGGGSSPLVHPPHGT